MWHRGGAMAENGVRFRLGGKGKVVEANDEFGNSAQYDWDDTGSLAAVRWRSPNGWHTVLSRAHSGSRLTITTPTQHEIQYDCEPTGLIRHVTVDGRLYARCRYQSGGRKVSIEYDDGRFAESLEYDDRDLLVRYTRTVSDNSPESATDSLSYRWDADRRLVAVEGKAVGKVVFHRASGRLVSLVSPASTWKYDYDNTERITGIECTGKFKSRFAYSDGKVSDAAITVDDRTFESTYTHGRVSTVRDFNGKVTEYRYDGHGNLTRIERPDGPPVTCVYDRENALIRVVCPGTYELRYEYRGGEAPSRSRQPYLYRIHITRHGG